MPDILPAANDEVGIVILGGPSATILVARLKAKEPDGKWLIELACDPPLRGKIDINRYEWSHTAGYWKKKPEASGVGGGAGGPSWEELKKRGGGGPGTTWVGPPTIGSIPVLDQRSIEAREKWHRTGR